LNTFKGDITAFLREKLKNTSIMVAGELQKEESQRTLYTDREKLDYLMQRNPHLKELKDRLGLDTDY